MLATATFWGKTINAKLAGATVAAGITRRHVLFGSTAGPPPRDGPAGGGGRDTRPTAPEHLWIPKFTPEDVAK